MIKNKLRTFLDYRDVIHKYGYGVSFSGLVFTQYIDIFEPLFYIQEYLKDRGYNIAI